MILWSHRVLPAVSRSYPRATRHVTHALLALSPLYLLPEGSFRVRLACFSHAASVRSEPGSNSSLVYRSTRPEQIGRVKFDGRMILVGRVYLGVTRPGPLQLTEVRSRGLKTQNPYLLVSRGF